MELAVLRALSFVAGAVLFAAPSYLLLLFAHGIGKPPGGDTSPDFFVLPLCIGFILGGGLLLIGLPRVVAGARSPAMRLVAGLLLISSAAIVIFLFGFSGTVTQVACPAILLLEVLVFIVFVWPARRFSITRDAPQEINVARHSGK